MIIGFMDDIFPVGFIFPAIIYFRNHRHGQDLLQPRFDNNFIVLIKAGEK